jgi:hypothetical protein
MFTSVNLFQMGHFLRQEWQQFILSSAISLETDSYYFVLRYLTVDAETVLCYAEHKHFSPLKFNWHTTLVTFWTQALREQKKAFFAINKASCPR